MKSEPTIYDLADAVRSLAIGGSLSEKFTRDPGPGQDGIRRPSAEKGAWRTSSRGLVHQLVAALTPGQASDGDTRPAGKPKSRQPSAAAVSDLLNEISLEASRTRAYVSQRGGTPTVRQRRTVITDLLDLQVMAGSLNPEDLAEVTGQLQQWVTRARAVLAMDAPVAALRDVSCPYCAGELNVRSDASGDVWCATRGCTDPNGKRPRWPKEQWPFMLEQIGGAA